MTKPEQSTTTVRIILIVLITLFMLLEPYIAKAYDGFEIVIPEYDFYECGE